MFEQEIEMERKSSTVVPLLLILALAGVIIGTAGYWFVQSRKVLTQQDATTAVTSILKAQGPAMLRFHTGTVKSSINEKPRDPHYKLLEKAGMVKLAPVKGKGETYDIALTPKGEAELTAVPRIPEDQGKGRDFRPRGAAGAAQAGGGHQSHHERPQHGPRGVHLEVGADAGGRPV